MTNNLPENSNRVLCESFKNLNNTLTWEGRNFGQSLSNSNNLLCDTMDILVSDLSNAIFGKIFKETLEGSNNSVTDGEHLIEYNLDVCNTSLFIEGQVLKLLVDS
jgi:hypothetical protein